MIATSLGHASVAESDAGLGRLLDAQPTLLVIDNAEDMMASEGRPPSPARSTNGSQCLGGTAHHNPLGVGGTQAVRELPIDIPPMSRAETDTLLTAELPWAR